MSCWEISQQQKVTDGSSWVSPHNQRFLAWTALEIYLSDRLYLVTFWSEHIQLPQSHGDQQTSYIIQPQELRRQKRLDLIWSSVFPPQLSTAVIVHMVPSVVRSVTLQAADRLQLSHIRVVDLLPDLHQLLELSQDRRKLNLNSLCFIVNSFF